MGGVRILSIRVLRCLTSIYGIDSSEDNVIECIERMRSVVETYLDGIEVTGGFAKAVGVILSTNIQQADALADVNQSGPGRDPHRRCFIHQASTSCLMNESIAGLNKHLNRLGRAARTRP